MNTKFVGILLLLLGVGLLFPVVFGNRYFNFFGALIDITFLLLGMRLFVI